MSWPEERIIGNVDFARHSLLWTALPPPAPQTLLSIKRTLYGSSQTRGVLFVSLSNNDHAPITVGYLETPAILIPWMHAMKVDVDANARGVLPKGMLRLSVDLSKTFLKYTEHPPDAMRGWDLPPPCSFPSRSARARRRTHRWQSILRRPISPCHIMLSSSATR